MFNPNDPPLPWDKNNVYKCDNLEMYFEYETKGGEPCLQQINVADSLHTVLQHEKCFIYGCRLLCLPKQGAHPESDRFRKSYFTRFEKITTL